MLKELHQSLKFCRWVRKYIRKSMSMKILFSDEKRLDINRLYNKQNDIIWASDCLQADKNERIHQKAKFPQSVMIWLGTCSNGIIRLMIIEKGTNYIDKIFPVALKDGKKTSYISTRWCIRSCRPLYSTMV